MTAVAAAADDQHKDNHPAAIIISATHPIRPLSQPLKNMESCRKCDNISCPGLKARILTDSLHIGAYITAKYEIWQPL